MRYENMTKEEQDKQDFFCPDDTLRCLGIDRKLAASLLVALVQAEGASNPQAKCREAIRMALLFSDLTNQYCPRKKMHSNKDKIIADIISGVPFDEAF